MIVYKYLPSARIDVLGNAAVRFTQPTAFNDPFETLPSFVLYLEGQKKALLADAEGQYVSVFSALGHDPHAAIDTVIDEVLSRTAEVWSKRIGILSLSKCRDNALMWSHYADSHRGYVVGFDSNNSFFNPGNEKAIDHLRAVKYSRVRAILPEFGFRDSTPEQVREATEYLFFTKSSDWAYEQEMRILADLSRASSIKPAENVGDWECCLFSFPHTAVKEIIFGSRMARDHRLQLVMLWKQRYPHAELFRTSLSPTEFAVNITPIDPSQMDPLDRLRERIAGQPRLIDPNST